MKTVVLFCSMMAVLFIGGLAHAHPNHVVTEPLSDLQVTDRADFLKMQLVVSGKLDESWSEVAPHSVEMREMADRRFWVVRYEDTRSGKEPQRFYMVLDSLGELVTATSTSGDMETAVAPRPEFVP